MSDWSMRRDKNRGAAFSEEDWSAKDILAHLRTCADVWGKHIVIMMMQDHPTLRYISPERGSGKQITPD